nr:ABC transporter permease [Clostridiales bacterium]
MQAIRNGIKSAVRTPWKTLLYTLVLLLLSVMLCVAFCVNSSVRGYLDECDDYFHTVVKFEYVGADYPDNFVYDGELEAAIDAHRAELDALCSAPEVMSFEPAYGSAALIDGLHRKDRLLYDPEFAVIKITVWHYIAENIDAYSAYLDECLYSRSDESGKLIMVRPEAGLADETRFEEGKSYLVCGRYFRGINSYVWFEAAPVTFTDGSGAVTVPALAELTGGSAETGLYARLAAYMRQCNDSCPVQFTAALMDQIPFHEQELMLTEGRSFTDAEYASKAKVCVVSDRLVSAVGAELGDKLGLSLISGGDLYGGLAPETASEEYEIVGVYGATDLHPYDVYLPDSNAAKGAVRAANGYGLGVFRIKNSEAAAFTARAERLEPHGFRFSVYDQGYSAAAKPMNEMLFISTVFLGICLLLALAALCLQCYMFISRQREAAHTMLALGSGKGHICLYFAACTAVVTLPAALLGCLAGRLLEGKVFGLMQSWLARFGSDDLRYSSSRLSVVRTLEFDPKAPLSVYAAAALTILLGALVCALVFTAFGMRDRAKKPKKLKKARRMRAPM